MRDFTPQTAMRKLIAAEGYLELGMPAWALEQVESLDHCGEMEPYAQFLRGLSLRELERYEEAIDPLHEAARGIPAPLAQAAWVTLGECFRHRGEDALADVAELFAECPGEVFEESESQYESVFDAVSEFHTEDEDDLPLRSGFDAYNFDE